MTVILSERSESKDLRLLFAAFYCGEEPNEWAKMHFANVGTPEEFVELFSGEFLEIVDVVCPT
jgi:hypothetical protein